MIEYFNYLKSRHNKLTKQKQQWRDPIKKYLKISREQSGEKVTSHGFSNVPNLYVQ